MSEVYKIGVSIALANGMSPVLALISKQLLGIHSKVGDIEKGMSRWGVAMGAAAAGIGSSLVVRGLWKIADHGKEILHQQVLLGQAGFTNLQIVEATTKAWEQSRTVQQTTAAENLKHIRELAYATGTIGGAQSILDPVTKANAILNSIKGGGSDQVFQMVKALEQKGLATEEKRASFMKYVDDMTRVVQSTGGRVTPEMFQSTFKYGRTAMLGWDEQFITRILPRLMQSWASGGGGGGSGQGGPGNALMTGFRQIVSGVMSKPAAELFEQLGLAKSERQPGTTKSYTKVEDAAGFIQNPYEWIQKYAMPALVKKFGTDQNKLIEELGVMFPVRTWGSAATEFGLQGRFMMGAQASPFEKDSRMTGAAKGIAGFPDLKANDPNAIDTAYNKQYENMMAAMGVALTPIKLEVVKGLTDLFTTIAKFAAANPAAIQAIGVTLGIMAGVGTAAAVVALGSAMAGMVAAAAPLAAALFAATAAIGALVGAANFLSGVKLPKGFSGGADGHFVPGGDGLPSYNPFDKASPAAPGKPEKHSWNVIRPAGGSGGRPVHLALMVDRHKLGEIMIGDIVDRASRPVEGSPYHDPTWQAMPLDTALG